MTLLPCVYVNSDLWIINFEDEMTWSNKTAISKHFFQEKLSQEYSFTLYQLWKNT